MKRMVQCILFSAVTIGGQASGYCQLLASANQKQKVPTAQSATTTLKAALEKFKEHFKVDLLYFDNAIEGRQVPLNTLDFTTNTDQSLDNLLRPLGLEFKKSASNGYVITKGREGRKRNKEKDVSVNVALPASNLSGRAENAEARPNQMAPLEISADVVANGKVTDEKGQGLPGVSVVQKGTQIGTTTNESGEFRLRVTDQESVLVFSYVGYLSQEIRVGNQTRIEITLKPDNKILDEVVVVGYGTQTKASLTGAVSTVNGDAIAAIPSTALSNSLAGRIPGATIINNSGFVGAPSSIQIRGLGTFNGTEPLFVIDGVIQPKAQFDVLDPNEVESISVLKDAATASIYGSRGPMGSF